MTKEQQEHADARAGAWAIGLWFLCGVIAIPGEFARSRAELHSFSDRTLLGQAAGMSLLGGPVTLGFSFFFSGFYEPGYYVRINGINYGWGPDR